MTISSTPAPVPLPRPSIPLPKPAALTQQLPKIQPQLPQPSVTPQIPFHGVMNGGQPAKPFEGWIFSRKNLLEVLEISNIKNLKIFVFDRSSAWQRATIQRAVCPSICKKTRPTVMFLYLYRLMAVVYRSDPYNILIKLSNQRRVTLEICSSCQSRLIRAMMARARM